MNYDADAIVIGSGHNGLISAVQLARRGWKVLVFEQSESIGGSAQSAEATLPGFCHDLHATNVGLFLGSAFYRENGDAMKQAGFEPVVSSQAYSSVFPNGKGIGITTDTARNRQEIARFNKADAIAWEQMCALFDRTSPHFLPLMQMPMPSLKALYQLWKLYRALKLSGSLELAQLVLKSPRAFVDHWFQSDEVKALIAPWAFHLDFGPDVANGALFPFIESVLNAHNGIAISRGGISQLPESLAELLRQSGGRIIRGQGVARVLVHHGRARGVKLASGKSIFAKRAVIGNVTPTQLIGELLSTDELPDKYVAKCRGYRYGPGTMMIHLALSEPLKWLAGDAFSQFSYVHVGPYVEDLSRSYTDALNGKLADEPMLVVGQPTVADATRAPAPCVTIVVRWFETTIQGGDGDQHADLQPRIQRANCQKDDAAEQSECGENQSRDWRFRADAVRLEKAIS